MMATRSAAGLHDVSMSSIEEQLDRLLAWPSFKNSKRYPKFLKYIVEKTASGSVGELKERVIGVTVFERKTDYEPATDPVVRLVAGETRKRLAQYYLQNEHSDELRIEIPLGSYVPIFYWPQQASLGSLDNVDAASNRLETRTGVEIIFDPATGGAPDLRIGSALVPQATSISWWQSRHFKSLVLGTATVFILITSLISAVWWIRTANERHLKAFWRPIVSPDHSTLICVGDWPDSTPGGTGRHFVGPYDLAATDRLTALLTGRHYPFSIRMANDVTLTDLRAGPGVMVGAVNNRWTSAILSSARYQFRTVDSKTNYIVDSQAPDNSDLKINAISNHSGTSSNQEVALISRIASPTTGQTEFIVAGAGAAGTVAASEFITNPEYFRQFADQAPHGWERRNIQIIISSNVINGSSGPPRIVRFDVR